MKPKIVVVAYHIGRIGSSAMMGILRIAGLKVGSENGLVSPAPINSKGFLELIAVKPFIKEAFRGYYPNITDPPPINEVIRFGKKNAGKYRELILSLLGNQGPYAIKAQRFLPLAFFYFLQDEFDIKVIVMNRQEEKQVDSIIRVWHRFPPEPRYRNVSRETVIDYVRQWKKFSLNFMEHFKFDYYPVSFEDLITATPATLRGIFDFIAEPIPESTSINQWLDQSLVNQPDYPW
ncbi:MAG: hypothetical protein KBA26_09115 [Candidatus Delongbacteria bacterium]|nr:hypothetical protein [Candidatus Delongbacteria bacterium]